MKKSINEKPVNVKSPAQVICPEKNKEQSKCCGTGGPWMRIGLKMSSTRLDFRGSFLDFKDKIH